MTNVTAALTEGQSVAKGYSDKNQAFTFRIPVYDNMPSSAVGFNKAGDTNNYLQSLSISGVTLTPSFNGATTSYSAVVSNSISSVVVSANPVSANSGITGTGSYSLTVGNNAIKINCKSQSGDTRTYTININRQASAANNTNNNNNTINSSVSISSSKYKIDTYVTGVEPNVSSDVIKKNISVSAGSIKILNSSGVENNGIVGTGNKIAVYDPNGNLVKTVDIVIFGDVNGDGKVTIKDIMLTNRNILKKISLNGEYLKAADVNKDGKVTIKDIMLINNSILGKSKLTQ